MLKLFIQLYVTDGSSVKRTDLKREGFPAIEDRTGNSRFHRSISKKVEFLEKFKQQTNISFYDFL